MRRLIPFALALVASPAAAQSIFDSGLRAGPQVTAYTFSAPVDEKISEFTVPIFALVPLTRGLTVDVGTAFASAHAEIAGQASDISGLTDTQVRANYTFGSDFVVLTAGVNIPTGKSRVGPAEAPAAMRIGSDFLAFPITNMGTGFGGTGGIAVARPLGDWNVGFGASFRKSAAYDPFQDSGGAVFHYQPGNEYRLRVGVDRTVGAGRATLGVTYSAFGSDQANGSLYNTGDRLITQASLTNAIGGAALTVSAWDLYRASGTLTDQSPLGADNIADLYLGLGFRPGGALLEPSVEVRNWQQEGNLPSTMATIGLRTEFALGALKLSPMGGYSTGKLAGSSAGTLSTLSGFHFILAARIGG